MRGILRPESWIIRPADLDEWPEVVECWYGYPIGSNENQQLASQLASSYPPFMAWGAWRHRRLEAAILLSDQLPCVHAWPIRTVYPLHDVVAAPQDTISAVNEQPGVHLARGIWSEVLAYYRRLHYSFAQCMIGIHQNRDILLMRSIGLQQLTTIEQYNRILVNQPPTGTRVKLQLNADTEYLTFRNELLRTFESTLDVPELNKIVSNSATGWEYQLDDNHRYFIMNGEDCAGVAVLIQNELTASLRYVGIAPAYRGRGLAGEAVSHLMQHALALGCSEMQVRVDARNAPAIKLYLRAGFSKVDEEVLLYQPLHLQSHDAGEL
jgi:ribosomal protein S18 acetylase RimI-like enzyme